MNLPQLSVKRPVTITMFWLGVVLLGFISLNRLAQELFPPITYPQLSVVTTYENAAPEEVETLITKIIEEAVGTVTNLKRVSSVSREGVSLVTAEFNWGTNMDFASLAVREKIDLIKDRLPRGSEEPVVMKYNPFDLPVMTLSVTGEVMPIELREACRKIIKNEIEKIEGVASANIIGGREREIWVEIDQGRLEASKTSIVSVVDALKDANLNYPAGTIEERFYEYLIRTLGEFKVVKEISSIPVGVDDKLRGAYKKETPEEQQTPEQEEEIEQGKRLILLSDIAKVKDAIKEQTSVSRYNGSDNITISVQKQSGANTVLVVNRIRKLLSRLKHELQQDIHIEVIYDQSKFIKGAISGVSSAAMQGAVLAFIVLLLFLRNIKSSLIIVTLIPVSILATFSLMFFQGISLNMISLGGLALGVGMLVDNGIVVLEDIYRLRQEGLGIKEAAIQGAKEMLAPVTSSTLTTVAVFLPLVFVIGIAGQIFKELAFTVTYSLTASLVVALTLVPRLSATGRATTGGFKHEREAEEGAIQRFTEKIILRPFLNFRAVSLLAVLAIFIMSIFLLSGLDREFLPKIDQRQFIIKVNMPPGALLKVTDSAVEKIEKQILKFPELDNVSVNVGSEKGKFKEGVLEALGSHQGQLIVNLKPRDLSLGAKLRALNPFIVRAAERSTQDIVQSLEAALKREDLGRAEVEYILQETAFKSAMVESAPIAIEVKGYNLDTLREASAFIQDRMKKVKGVFDVKTTLTTPAPETKVNIVKDKAALYNLSTRDISLISQIAIKGYVATKFKEEGGREIDIRVRLRPEDRQDFIKLRRVMVHSPLNIEVPLDEVTTIGLGTGPSEIKRLDQQRVIVLSGQIYKRPLKDVISDINNIIGEAQAYLKKRLATDAAKKTEEETSIILAGESLQMSESFGSLRFALILSIILVYMIMAAQFESLWQPFIIMFTLPLSLIGVAGALYISHTTLNAISLLGIIILGGIVVNNGIVLIDCVNMLRAQGVPLEEALVKASKLRLRPILMTALTTILGLVPLALGIGEGSELQTPMAITVMGGLTAATFLTLNVIPALYLSWVRTADFILGRKETPTIVIARSEAPQPSLRATTSPVIASPAKGGAKQSNIEITPSFTERKEKLLAYLKERGRITRKEYADLLKISVPTAARDLKAMMKAGIIKASGPLGPGRYYELENKEG